MPSDVARPVTTDEWMDAFRRRVAGQRVPLNALLELTSRCNLRCVHCYLGSQEEQHRQRDREMDTDTVRSVLDQLAEEGCLYLTITGGDPMMRKDFADIYRHAKELGMLVTVFCDAILVTDRILELFAEYPPLKVEVSIYGATAKTYEKVTRVQGSFEKAVRGIHRLLEGGVRLSLKTVLMTLNEHELGAMESWARDLDVPFKFDGAIFPCHPNRDASPLDVRLDARTVVEREMADPERRCKWVESYDRAQSAPESEYLYTCGAGASSVYIDPFAHASPCLMTTQYRFEVTEKGFAGVWRDDISQVRKLKRSGAGLGDLRGACSDCPGCNYLETGREDVESDYVRALRRHRYEAIMAEKSKT